MNRCEWKDGKFEPCDNLETTSSMDMAEDLILFEMVEIWFCPFCGADIRKPESKTKIDTGGLASDKTLRDYFASQADVPWDASIKTLELNGVKEPTMKQLADAKAVMKYVEADAMIEARRG